MTDAGLSPQMEAAIKKGPPYPSFIAVVGGIPTISIDVPVDSVLICLYLCSAVANMTIFQLNKRKGHLFIPSAVLFGFSMARVITLVLRISWACFPNNPRLALAAQIFINAGILVVYIVNLIFTQRLVRALQPPIGWHPRARTLFDVLYALTFISLCLIVSFLVYGTYTLSESFHNTQEWILRAVSTYLLVFAALPLALVPLAFALPRHRNAETFGEGSMRHKAAILLAGTCMTTIIAGFRTGTSWMPPRSIDNPAWYDSRAALYCFNFMLELLTLLLYTTASIDKIFHVPNGSSKRQTYVRQDQIQSSGSNTDVSDGDVEQKSEADISA